MSAPKKYRHKTYEPSDKGLVWWRPTDDGGSPMLLANFSARIIASYLLDDGSEGLPDRVLKLECTLNNKKTVVVSVPARKFTMMDWPLELLGPRAQVGVNCRDRLRAAILACSSASNMEEHNIYSHTGWREIGGRQVYLHSGGAISGKGAVKIETQVSHALERFDLPDPRKKPEIVRAIRASMKMLEVAPDRVSFALFAAVWRAVLGHASFSVHLTGRTGAGKSAIAALAQQHYGPKMDGDHLPGSWTSSINANEALAFEAKDALFVIDDFNPIGNASDVARWHKDADRLFRGQGNQAGRARMRADTSIRAPKWPRGVILSTGEDTPNGQSLKARLLIVEIAKGELDFKKLTACQSDAAAGLYSMALSGFIRWLAPRIANAEKAMQKAVTEYRSAAAKIGDQSHMRTPDNVANLMQGFHFWLQFATSHQAITTEKRAELWKRACHAFDELIRVQTVNQTTADPTQQFIQLIGSAFAGGRAHLCDSAGGRPKQNAAEFGWKHNTDARPTTWTARGQQIGWTRDGNMYLEPTNTFAIVQAIAKETGQHITLSLTTLLRRLKQANLLASTDESRETITIRRTLEGAQHSVLHFLSPSLYPSDKPGKPDISPFSKKSAWQEIGLEPDILPENGPNSKPTRHPQTTEPKRATGKMSGLAGTTENRRGGALKLLRGGKKRVSGKHTSPDMATGETDKWTETRAFIMQLYPTTGEPLIQQIAAKCVAIVEDISDAELCTATRAAFQERKKYQTSAGLFLETVPAVVTGLKAERKQEKIRLARIEEQNDQAEKTEAYAVFVNGEIDAFIESANGNLAAIRKESMAKAKKECPRMMPGQLTDLAENYTRHAIRDSLNLPSFTEFLKSGKAATA
jgi:hypothetical protein